MRAFFTDFSQQLRGIWARLDGGQRLVVASVLLATVVGLGAIVWYAGQPSYRTVFTGTSSDELASARRALESNNISYVPDGMSFMVDADDVSMAAVALREAGLMSEAKDDGLDASSIIDDAQTKAWKLANASIARAESAVRNIEGVTGVNITAAAARRVRAFVDTARANQPTATVLLKLRMGTPFEATAHTAAAATASQLGIPLPNVTVANAVGGARWRYDPDREAGGGSSEFMAMQRNIAREKTIRAQELLDQLWPGKTSVAVTVELDPAWEVISEKVLPKEELLRSEKSTKKTSEQSSGDANAVGVATSGVGDPVTTNTTKDETKDREFVTEIGERRSGKHAPEIRRLSVALVYDRSLEDADGFNKDELTRSVKTMVGWDSQRDSDESFSVMPGEFAPVEPLELITSETGFIDVAARWAPTVGQILGVIVVLFFLRGLFKRSGGRSAAGAPSAGVAGAEEVPERDLSPEEQQRKMRREIERAIASDPAALARLLESWLVEQSA